MALRLDGGNLRRRQALIAPASDRVAADQLEMGAGRGPEDRRALATTQFERIGVLGVDRVWVEPTP